MANTLVLISGAQADGLSKPAREALGVAQSVSASLKGSVAVALDATSPSAIAELGERGFSHVFRPAAEPCPNVLDFYARAVAESGARVVIVNRGPDLLQIIPRLAARVGGSCVMQATSIEVGGEDITVSAAIYGGAARAEYRFRGDGPRIVALAPVSLEAPARVENRVANVTELEVVGDPRVRVIREAQPSTEARLEDARIVVSGGRGLRKSENYVLVRELANVLGGMPGASRAIVDESWAQPSEQVGLTGKIVTPDLYFAIGISGASQHMAGCSNARTLVAVNTDPDAPIFRYAQYGIVADCLEVLPELIEQSKNIGIASKS